MSSKEELNVAEVKKVLNFLDEKYPDSFKAYRTKAKQKVARFWFITTEQHDIYFSKKFETVKKVVRVKFNLKDKALVFVLVPMLDQLLMKEKEKGDPKLVLKPS